MRLRGTNVERVEERGDNSWFFGSQDAHGLLLPPAHFQQGASEQPRQPGR